jgi:hypothetical protein
MVGRFQTEGSLMAKERNKSGGAMKVERPADGKKSAAHLRRTTQMLAIAETRDLTPDELRVLSVVQLSEYATIQRNRVPLRDRFFGSSLMPSRFAVWNGSQAGGFKRSIACVSRAVSPTRPREHRVFLIR